MGVLFMVLLPLSYFALRLIWWMTGSWIAVLIAIIMILVALFLYTKASTKRLDQMKAEEKGNEIQRFRRLEEAGEKVTVFQRRLP